MLTISGAALEGICYYRYLDDYLRIKNLAAQGKSAVVIGGGFIGSEMAAALTMSKLNVTMIFLSAHICNRVFPDYLGLAVQQRYEEAGVRMLSEEKPAAIAKNGEQFVTVTESGKRIQSDIVIIGVGVLPETKLARQAGLETGDGIVVNSFLQTSNPDIYAAGDNAQFPYIALGKSMRVEHWDNALNQGKWAGRNMAGGHDQYTYMPYFFSDLFEFGYEAVGEVDAGLETYADWQKENDTGVIYYLRNGKVRGAMMCNVWNQVATARQLIQRAESMTRTVLQGSIL